MQRRVGTSMHHSRSLIFYYICVILPLCCAFSAPQAGHGHQFEATDAPPLLNVPTYSLATINEDGSTNMNILTYATPTSARPDRIWTLGIFKGTLTEENLLRREACVLQLLTEEHAPLVATLGGTCGRDADKLAVCMDASMGWDQLPCADGVILPRALPRCAHYLQLSVQGDFIDVGSHWAVNCKVESMWQGASTNDGPSSHLMTAKLRKLGIITEQGRVARDDDA